MKTIFPLRIPISPEYQGEPVPSMIRPLVMTISKDCAGSWASVGTKLKSKTTHENKDFHR